MALGEIFKDAVFRRCECGRGAVDCIEHDDDLGGVVHCRAIDGVKCGELARLVVVKEDDVFGIEIGDGFAGCVRDLHVEYDAPGGRVLAVALFFGASLECGILGRQRRVRSTQNGRSPANKAC